MITLISKEGGGGKGGQHKARDRESDVESKAGASPKIANGSTFDLLDRSQGCSRIMARELRLETMCRVTTHEVTELNL